MTIITTISILLTALFAFLLGRCMFISSRRLKRILRHETDINKLEHRLYKISDSSSYDRFYEIIEDRARQSYNVNMRVYIRVSTYAGEHLDTVCDCLIKSFPFADDKQFASSEAEELLDKLNE